MHLEKLLERSGGRLRIGKQSSIVLDLVRAFAAMLVMFGHVRTLFFVPNGLVQGQGHFRIVTKAIYELTSFGHEAVMVFFVLSGFFISASALKSVASRRWSWSWYLNQRLTRLWIVLLPALLLGAFWDQLGMHLFSSTHI